MTGANPGATLGPELHEQAWQQLAGGQVDVLVVGGGVTGT